MQRWARIGRGWAGMERGREGGGQRAGVGMGMEVSTQSWAKVGRRWAWVGRWDKGWAWG
jgi:hypothetical protein